MTIAAFWSAAQTGRLDLRAPDKMLRKFELNPSDLESIRHLIPGPEPVLESPGNGRAPLRVSEPSLDGNELRYVTDCIQSNWISSAGPYVSRFENAFARRCGCEFGVACSSGTSAFHLILAALGIGPGDEVIIPAFTMIATANGVAYTGATVRLVDAEVATWNMDVSQVEKKINARTKAVAAVHTYGHPAEMDGLAQLAGRHGLTTIEDAAEAHGALYHGRPVGGLGDAAAFSFYGNKILTTGEGGMVTTNNRELAEIIRNLRDHAFSSDRHFWHSYRGFNYRMTNLQAAVGLAQTERLDELVGQRIANAGLYRAALQGIPGLTLPPESNGVRNVFWMFSILVGDDFGCSRDALRRHLARNGIETRTMFIPMHLQPAFFEENRDEKFPVAESLCRQGMYLPSSAKLTPADIEFVAAEIRKAHASGGDV